MGILFFGANETSGSVIPKDGLRNPAHLLNKTHEKGYIFKVAYKNIKWGLAQFDALDEVVLTVLLEPWYTQARFNFTSVWNFQECSQ